MSDSWDSPVQYPPLDEQQKPPLDALRKALDKQDNHKAIDIALHEACFVLFAHQRFQYPTSAALGKHFTPVVVYITYHSLLESATFKRPSAITHDINPLMYSIRGTILTRVVNVAKERGVSVFEYVLTCRSQLVINSPPGFSRNTSNTFRMQMRHQWPISSTSTAFCALFVQTKSAWKSLS